MENLKDNVSIDKNVILADVLEILEDLTSDWEMGLAGPIGPETCLVADLAFESVDIVQLAVSIEEHFNRQDLPFQQLLMVDGRYVKDLRAADLVDFLYEHLNRV